MAVHPMGPGDPEAISEYVLQGRLGSGGMGTVYLSSTRGGQPVAIKTVRPDLATDARFRKRFEQEVQAARQVRGRYIANVVDSNTEGPMPWLATEYVPGVSLAQALSSHGPLPVRTCLGVAAGVANALETIHAARIIHRDLKPGNVILTQHGLAVIDFGIARALDSASPSGGNTRIGTPAFMPPEQIKGDAPATSAADVFSLGLTLHVAATDTHPFGAEMFAAVPYLQGSEPDLSACPEPLRELIGRCLAMDPADRPSAAEVLAECRAAGRRCGFDEVLPGAEWLPEQFTVVSVPAPQQSPVPAAGSAPPLPSPPSPARAGRARTRPLIVGGALLGAGAVTALAVWIGLTGGDGDDAADGKPSSGASAPPSPTETTGATDKPRAVRESERHLADRVKKGLKDCKPAEALYEIDGARATLSCTPRHGKGAGISAAEADGITVHTASFAGREKLEAFLDAEKDEVRDDGEPVAQKDPSTITLDKDDFPYQGPVENAERVQIGHAFAHEDAYGSSTISWTFENDYYVDRFGEYFVVTAESGDRGALVGWWNTWPV